MKSTRSRIIQATCSLMEKQGYHATGVNEILRVSGAPKGSLYYYFPEGKEALVQEAISQTTQELVERIRENLALFPDPVEAVQVFVSRIADHIELSQFSAGGPLTAVAMETATGSERLNLACREAFAAIQSVFAEKLAANGYAPESAAQLALFITSAIEGGTLLSRTAHSGDPLRRVAEVLAVTLVSFRRENPNEH
jgi:TetR/AcrR family transcriptional repressor of lmrAB and yxaGH operons